MVRNIETERRRGDIKINEDKKKRVADNKKEKIIEITLYNKHTFLLFVFCVANGLRLE